MPRRGAISRRTAIEWGIRGMLVVLVTALGYLAVTGTAGYSMRKRNIERAYALAPGDGRITALLAESLIKANSTAADLTRAERLARAALKDDPTALPAVWTLGACAQMRGDVAGARRLFAYAQTLSRRDLATQIWAIEDAVARDDVVGALRHYDIALRTSRRAPPLLFPLLASAISDPEIRAKLILILAARPHWGEGFVNYVAESGPDPRAAASLFGGLQKAGIPISDAVKSSIVSRLVSGKFLAEAWAYFEVMRPGVERSRSRDPWFANDVEKPTIFDWVVAQDGGISAAIQRDGDKGVFDFSVSSSLGGPLLRQAQMLPRGSYRLEGDSRGIDQPIESRPFWVLACDNGRELGRVPLPNSGHGASGRFVGSFTVPDGCPSQMLTLVARPSDMLSGNKGQITRAEIVPVG